MTGKWVMLINTYEKRSGSAKDVENTLRELKFEEFGKRHVMERNGCLKHR
jgi:hypothetical protein